MRLRFSILSRRSVFLSPRFLAKYLLIILCTYNFPKFSLFPNSLLSGNTIGTSLVPLSKHALTTPAHDAHIESPAPTSSPAASKITTTLLCSFFCTLPHRRHAPLSAYVTKSRHRFWGTGAEGEVESEGDGSGNGESSGSSAGNESELDGNLFCARLRLRTIARAEAMWSRFFTSMAKSNE